MILPTIEERRRVPLPRLSEMIRKAYEVNLIVSAHCGGQMRIISFLRDFSIVDRIINNYLKFRFVAPNRHPLALLFRKFSWPPRPAVNIFHNLLVDRQERSVPIPAL